MPEFPPPNVAQDAAERDGPALTPGVVSAVLDDFRAWLTELTSPPLSPSSLAEESRTAEAKPIDLHTLLGQFVAVRQEVNLQTRAVRAQQEQNNETLRQLSAALEELRQSQVRGERSIQEEIDEAIRPLLKTLIDLYDALALASREMQRLRETVLPSLEQLAAPLAPTALAAREAEEQVAKESSSRSFWGRLFGTSSPAPPPQPTSSPAQEERERQARESSERVRQLLGSLVTGYTMSVQRIDRALRQHGLEAIPTQGQRFDPERMEVVEAVADTGRPSGEILDEVRRGYLWEGRVFRYAQVRVAKS